MTALFGKTFFLLGTLQGRANRPCEGDGVSEKPTLSDAAPHFSLGQNFHYNIDSNKIEGDLINNIEIEEPDHVWDNHPDDRVELFRTRARRQAREIAC